MIKLKIFCEWLVSLTVLIRSSLLVRWLRGWVLGISFVTDAGTTHFAHGHALAHLAAAGGGARAGSGVSLLHLDALQVLLVLNLLLLVLVALQKLVVVALAHLKALGHAGLKLLLKCIHLILLLLEKFGLSGENLSVSLLHVSLTFLVLHLVGLLLHLVSILVLLLTGQVLLDLLQVEQLSGQFKCHRQRVFEVFSVLLQLLGMFVLESDLLLLIVLLCFLELAVPVFVELLVLLDVCLLALLSLLCLVKQKFLASALVILLLQLSHAILGHLGLDVPTFGLTRLTVLLHGLDELLDVFRVNLVVLARLLLHVVVRVH